jgi:large subunit ribosomal protein L13
MLSKCSANNAKVRDANLNARVFFISKIKSALAYCRMWHFMDASSAPLGRMATKIASLLQGKHKLPFTPHNDCGDYVIVRNAANLVLTGRKWEQKEYIHHTGFTGGLKITPISTLEPGEIVKRAVKGMLPKNKLRQLRLDRLKVSQKSVLRNHLVYLFVYMYLMV